jgi:UDP-glucose 4-epimerase
VLALVSEDRPSTAGVVAAIESDVALVIAVLRLANSMEGARRGKVESVVGAVEVLSGRRVPVAEAPRRPGDPPALVAEPGRAGAVLGWGPRRSDLATVVGTAWRWHETLAQGRSDRTQGYRRAG